MIRLIARPAWVITVSITLLIIALRLTARPDQHTAAFFAPPADCALPCWQGITPGATTIDEAVALLEANTWVEGITRTDSPPSTALVNWTWSSDYPYGSGSTEPPPTLIGRGGVVWQVYLPTNLRFGDVWALLGAPDGGTVETSGTSWTVWVDNIAFYRDKSLWAETSITGTCLTVDPAALWQWRTSFWLRAGAWTLPQEIDYPIYVTALRTGYYRVRAIFC